jgi:hypothetical protein
MSMPTTLLTNTQGAVVLYGVHLQAFVGAAAGLHHLLVLALEAGMRGGSFKEIELSWLLS